MAQKTLANCRGIAHKGSGGMSIVLLDVCLVPTAAGPIPLFHKQRKKHCGVMGDMLRGQGQQMEPIGRAYARERFVDEMVVHLHGFAPKHVDVIGDDGVLTSWCHSRSASP